MECKWSWHRDNFKLPCYQDTMTFLSCRYVGVTDEQHRMQLSLYKSTLEGVGTGGGVEGRSEGREEGVDGDYVKATSGNR